MRTAIRIILLVMVFSGALRAQHREARRAPLEFRDDAFIPLPRSTMTFSLAYSFSSPNFFTTQVNVDSLNRNIVGDAANEPSIAVDPTNPNRMVIGWRQFNTITSNFRQAGYAYTTDGGRRWRFPGVIQPGIFRSDPVLDADRFGNFYYNSLTQVGGGFQCNVFKSTNGGATWDAGVFAQGGDKQWMIVDRTASIGEGNHYAFWTSSFSACPPGQFTRSNNRGTSYELCLTIPQDPFWGTLATGPSGELYIAGIGDTSFVVVKSWSARDSSRAVTWDSTQPVSLDGDLVAFAGTTSPNPSGLHGQAWIATDIGNGPYRGYVYLLASVARNSNTDPLDVMFARSTNGGATWSAPRRINDDPSTTAWQWFGTMSVAPSGRIDVCWLDTRDNPGSVHSSLYYSYSTNGGASWSANTRLSQSFNPHLGWPQQNKIGDYIHMVSDNGGAHLAWAATFGGEQNVYYSRIDFPLTAVEEQRVAVPLSFSLEQNYPNPFNPKTIIKYQLPMGNLSAEVHGTQAGSHFVSLRVYDVLGREIATLVNETVNPGRYSVEWDASSAPSGVYFYRMDAGAFTQTRRLVVLK